MVERNKRTSLVGIVVSDKMDKTVVVRVQRLAKHPVFKKYIRHSKRYHAHDGENACRKGDKVLIEQTRPLSKLKRWRVKEVMTSASAASAESHPSEAGGAS